ncbi:hypothetical protein FRC20_004436 [Serendipita sp. 405]|nr:hypothetical protein FRC20_004436 [Serendipita sp. 405]
MEPTLIIDIKLESRATDMIAHLRSFDPTTSSPKLLSLNLGLICRKFASINCTYSKGTSASSARTHKRNKVNANSLAGNGIFQEVGGRWCLQSSGCQLLAILSDLGQSRLRSGTSKRHEAEALTWGTTEEDIIQIVTKFDEGITPDGFLYAGPELQVAVR